MRSSEELVIQHEPDDARFVARAANCDNVPVGHAVALDAAHKQGCATASQDRCTTNEVIRCVAAIWIETTHVKIEAVPSDEIQFLAVPRKIVDENVFGLEHAL